MQKREAKPDNRWDKAADTNGTGEELLLTGFKIGDAVFGIDARLVVEVVKVGEVTPVHGAPSGVCGIRNLRGRIVTVVDMSTHFGLGCVELGPESRLLLMEDRGEPFGFLVDEVTDTLAVNPKRIDRAPAGMDPNLRGRLKGVWREEGQLTAILDPQALFSWSEE